MSVSMFCVQFSLKLISIYFLILFNKSDCINKQILCVVTVRFITTICAIIRSTMLIETTSKLSTA